MLTVGVGVRNTTREMPATTSRKLTTRSASRAARSIRNPARTKRGSLSAASAAVRATETALATRSGTWVGDAKRSTGASIVSRK